MYFKFPCKHCGKNLKISEEYAGRKARCPYCRNAVVVPTAPPAPAKPKDQPSLDSFGDLESSGDFGASFGELPPGLDGTGEQAGSATATATAPDATATQTQDSAEAPSAKRSDGTGVGLLTSGTLALGMTTVFYLGMLMIKGTYFSDLFIARGWVPYAETAMFFWAFSILGLKWRKLRRQRETMLFDVLPTDLADEIGSDNVDRFTTHVRSLPCDPSESFLINRVLRGLEHFRVRKSNPETAALLQSQSDIDGASVDSSYTLIKVFIWAIPILGFIGTVQGMSEAVGAFSGALEAAEDPAELMGSLNNVTSGLGTAFDTTLVALVMSLIVMFPTSSTQKAEDDLLTRVDGYCNDNLLRRLRDDSEEKPESTFDNQTHVVKAINTALAPHHAEIQSWHKKMEVVGQQITDKVAEGWSQISSDYQGKQEAVLAQLAEVQALLAESQAAAAEKFKEVSEAVQGQSETLEQTRQQAYQEAEKQVEEALNNLVQQAAQTQEQVAATVKESADLIKASFSGLEQGIVALNTVLSSLGEKQVVIEMQAPQRRGWRLFGGRSNGVKHG